MKMSVTNKLNNKCKWCLAKVYKSGAVSSGHSANKP